MTLKRVLVHGYIEIPEGADLPELGQFVTIGEFTAEVRGESREKQVRRNEAVELVYTAKTGLPEGCQILKIEDPKIPLFEQETSDEEDEGLG
jgi:hypothetical protein